MIKEACERHQRDGDARGLRQLTNLSMVPAQDLLAYAVAVFHLAWIPGPSWMTTLAAARQRQAAAAALAVLGVAVANLVFIVGAGILKFSGFILPVALRKAAGLVGCLTLVILAFRIFFAKRPLIPSIEPATIVRPFLSSMTVHLLNPNSWTFYISVFLAATSLSPDLVAQISLLGGIAVLADLMFMSLIAIGVAYAVKEVPDWLLSYAGKVAGVCMAYLGTSNALRLMGLA